jgi:hypothetical protein
MMCPCSASHVVILLVKNYPQYKIVNFDKLEYCSSLKNLEEIESYPNYTFVKVGVPINGGGWGAVHLRVGHCSSCWSSIDVPVPKPRVL